MRIIKKILLRFKEPLFILFFVTASLVWYINRINGTYVEDIDIPVYISGVENPTQDNLDKFFLLQARVKAKGYKLLMFKYFPSFLKIQTNIADIIVKNGVGDYVIDNEKLEGVITSNFNKSGEILRLYINNIKLANITYGEKKVPVLSDIFISLAKGYMEVSPIRFIPDSVLIMSDIENLKSINGIYTDKLTFIDVRHNLAGNIQLRKNDGVKIMPDHVEYKMYADRFASVKKSYKVEVVDSNGASFISVPSVVEVVYNVSELIYSKFNASDCKVYVDKVFEDSDQTEYVVKVKNIPLGVKVVSINPNIVNVFKK